MTGRVEKENFALERSHPDEVGAVFDQRCKVSFLEAEGDDSSHDPPGKDRGNEESGYGACRYEKQNSALYGFHIGLGSCEFCRKLLIDALHECFRLDLDRLPVGYAKQHRLPIARSSERIQGIYVSRYAKLHGFESR